MTWWSWLLLAVVLYLLPTIIGRLRDHRNLRALWRFNLFASWMVFPWFMAMVWAIYKDPSVYWTPGSKQKEGR